MNIILFFYRRTKKNSGLLKNFRIAMLPCYQGFSLSALLTLSLLSLSLLALALLARSLLSLTFLSLILLALLLLALLALLSLPLH